MSLSDLRLLYMRMHICMNLSLPNPELHICSLFGSFSSSGDFQWHLMKRRCTARLTRFGKNWGCCHFWNRTVICNSVLPDLSLRPCFCYQLPGFALETFTTSAVGRCSPVAWGLKFCSSITLGKPFVQIKTWHLALAKWKAVCSNEFDISDFSWFSSGVFGTFGAHIWEKPELGGLFFEWTNSFTKVSFTKCFQDFWRFVQP